ncbi:MAG: ATP-binding cassette domain-containing protein [Rikenellaceae bacterium]
MLSINLNRPLPLYFSSGVGGEGSDIWDNTLVMSRGKSYLVLANSGRGKTSLCSFLYGMRYDYSGVIAFDNRELRSLKTADWIDVRKSSLSLFFQDMRLFSELTSFENIELNNRLTNYKKKSEIKELLAVFGLESKVHQKLERLSLGEQQRVAFIRSLCQPFDFILLDEPVSHLDEDNAAIMASVLKEELKSREAGVIVTSVGNTLDLAYDKILKL